LAAGGRVGLTSPALVALLVATSAGLLVATLWSWPRLAPNRFRTVALRVVALCALQLSVLALIFVIVNRSAEFYSSWSDLFGTDNSSAAITSVHYGVSRTQAPVAVTGISAVPVPGRSAAPRGRLESVRIHGALSGITVRGYVYEPARHYRATRSGGARPLAVIVVISDEVSSGDASFGAGRLAATAAAQIAAGRIGPSLLVMLPARFGPADQGCLNQPGGPQAATFFAQDLPRAIENRYPVSPPRRWALLADSSGGYCALQLAMTNSQTYAAAALPPGSYTAPPDATAALYGGSPQIRTEDNLAWLLQHQPMQPISVLFTGHGRAQPFLSQARRPMRAQAAGLAAGRWPLAPALDWLGRVLAEPSAGQG
jgi:enterochelin esterase-like enzyme